MHSLCNRKLIATRVKCTVGAARRGGGEDRGRIRWKAGRARWEAVCAPVSAISSSNKDSPAWPEGGTRAGAGRWRGAGGALGWASGGCGAAGLVGSVEVEVEELKVRSKPSASDFRPSDLEMPIPLLDWLPWSHRRCTLGTGSRHILLHRRSHWMCVSD